MFSPDEAVLTIWVWRLRHAEGAEYADETHDGIIASTFGPRRSARMSLGDATPQDLLLVITNPFPVLPVS